MDNLACTTMGQLQEAIDFTVTLATLMGKRPYDAVLTLVLEVARAVVADSADPEEAIERLDALNPMAEVGCDRREDLS